MNNISVHQSPFFCHRIENLEGEFKGYLMGTVHLMDKNLKAQAKSFLTQVVAEVESVGLEVLIFNNSQNMENNSDTLGYLTKKIQSLSSKFEIGEKLDYIINALNKRVAEELLPFMLKNTEKEIIKLDIKLENENDRVQRIRLLRELKACEDELEELRKGCTQEFIDRIADQTNESRKQFYPINELLAKMILDIKNISSLTSRLEYSVEGALIKLAKNQHKELIELENRENHQNVVTSGTNRNNDFIIDELTAKSGEEVFQEILEINEMIKELGDNIFSSNNDIFQQYSDPTAEEISSRDQEIADAIIKQIQSKTLLAAPGAFHLPPVIDILRKNNLVVTAVNEISMQNQRKLN